VHACGVAHGSDLDTVLRVDRYRGRVERIFFSSPRFCAGRMKLDDGTSIAFSHNSSLCLLRSDIAAPERARRRERREQWIQRDL
jgi:hypothetical protein